MTGQFNLLSPFHARTLPYRRIEIKQDLARRNKNVFLYHTISLLSPFTSNEPKFLNKPPISEHSERKNVFSFDVTEWLHIFVTQ